MDSRGRSNLEKPIALLVYLSVGLGAFLLIQVWGLLPTAVFFSILAGWVAYFVTSIFVALRNSKAYPVVLVLAVLTLAVSLPQPAHYAFVTNAQILAASTFIVGSALQVALIIMISWLFLRRRRR